MTRKPGFDDEFRPKGQRWGRRIRSLGWTMSLVVVCGVVLAVTTRIQENPRRASRVWF